MPKILAIDDTRDNLISISALLKKLIPDCTVITSDSGAEGIKKAEAEQPNTILLDIRMPEMDGFEVCRRLKSNEKTKHIPVVMLTAIKSDAESRVKGLEIGADAFLSKPIDEVELAAHVKVMLRIKTAEDLLRKEKDLLEDTVHERTKALRESEERFRLAFENANDGVCLVDTDGNLARVNDRMCDIFGYSKKELESMTVNDIAHPEDKDISPTFIKESISGEVESTVFEKRYFHKQGHIIWGQVSSSIIKDAKGDLLFFISHVQDITQRKQAEETQHESEEKYRSLVESTDDCIYLVDRNCVYLFMNEKTLTRFGLSKDKAMGTVYADYHSKDDSKDFAEKVKAVFETGKSSVYEHESQIKGEYFLRTLSPVKKPDGKITSVTVISKNITKRKRIEEDLQIERDNLRNIFESMEDGTYIVNQGYDIQYVNQVLVKEFGPYEGIKCYRYFHDRDEVCPWCKNKDVWAGKTVRWEWYSFKNERTYDLIDTPMTLPDGSIGKLEIFHNITERKQVEEDLRQTNEELSREQNQRKILSMRLIDLLENDRRQVSRELHDHIGQILTSLKMDIEMIHEKLKPEYRDLAARITSAQEKTIQAIRDVKNISRGLRPGMLDALGLLPSLRELFSEIQRQTDMEIHFFSRNIPKRIASEKELAIYRIAQEALTNIIRHAQAKNIFVNLVRKGEKFSLSAEDDGVGFDQDKVMTFSKKKGPLGILIMRERAEQLDGDFTLESHIGKGTHVLVEIPI